MKTIECPVCDLVLSRWRTQTNAYRVKGGQDRIRHSNLDVLVHHVIDEHPGVYERYMGKDEYVCDACGNLTSEDGDPSAVLSRRICLAQDLMFVGRICQPCSASAKECE